MKKRKGFTLVEFLIIILIIGILSTVMMLSMGSIRGRAKAASIMYNVDLCKTAALIYASNPEVDAESTDKWIFSNDELVTNFKNFENTSIKYEALGKKKIEEWGISIDITDDASSTDILKALKLNKNYEKVGDTGRFYVNLLGPGSADKH